MPTPEDGPRRVLIHTPIGRDGPASAELLRRAGIESEICATLPQLVAMLDVDTAAVFVAEEGLFRRDLTALFDWVADQPPWSDLPFVVLTSRNDLVPVRTWRSHLITSLRNVSLLERPVQGITLTSALQAAIRARTRQYEVRELLAARERLTQQLEGQVEARTKELAEANQELRRQMAERARIEDSLRQAQKLEAVGQLTGGIAHDFNNLLMVISGGLDMIDRQADPARRQRIMEGMRQAAARGSALTRQLLAFSRRQPLHPESVDLAAHVGQMGELLDRSLRGDVHVETEFAPDLWPVEVDPGELQLVILNLAVNARDAMPEGGTIMIKGENVPGHSEPRILCDSVRLSIIDTGTGMAPEIQERVFEPYFTTKEVGKGSGLGLPQVYGFAAQSGGSVRIESECGKGTSIILLLPRADANPIDHPQMMNGSDQLQPSAGSAGTILLVEDDSEVAALVTEMLVHLGYRVAHVASARAALEALGAGRKVDLVFSDIMMAGGMSGLELRRELQRCHPDIPILLTSGYADADSDTIDMDGARILTKPYQLEELAAALRRARDSSRSADRWEEAQIEHQ